jgi:hypothetical protein
VRSVEAHLARERRERPRRVLLRPARRHKFGSGHQRATPV